MTERDKVNILIVDDQPGKLLALEAILADLGENIIKANSADEGLKHLLAEDIAIVLVDVCMPQMDGFELAEMIRGHPRYRRTAIIFISAVHLTDDDRLRGYGLGAVDYIPVPIIPEVLRAKVAVFAELYRKTDELQRLNTELEQRVAQRTADLEASTLRLRLAAEAAHFGIYEFDPRRKESYWSPQLKAICGIDVEGPVPESLFVSIVHPEDATMFREVVEKAMRADSDGDFETEFRIIHPEKGVRWLLDKGRVKFVGEGAKRRAQSVLGTVFDITERRRLDEATTMLAALVESSQDAIISKTLDGVITSWNAGAERLFGYTAAEAIGKPIELIIPSELGEEQADIRSRLSRGESIGPFDTVRVDRYGRRIDISLTISVVRDARNRIVGASNVARDITERKRAEEVLTRDRETLERLVAERTAELDRSKERLRLADRMATIGTLSAGLGHDMGNLLLPIRMRLDSIEATELTPSARADVHAIRQASEYLQRLARSLRLLAIDPESESDRESATNLTEWWIEAEGMVRNGLPRHVTLHTDISADLPPVRMGKAGLTQVVFNLVQNAGDALRARAQGAVTIRACRGEADDFITVSIVDDGPGMSEETRKRCMEPFFTTKTRGLSTGLGLTLVSGLLKKAGGTMQIHTQLDRGTTFQLQLPAAPTLPCRARAERGPAKSAKVTLTNPRLRAHVSSVLESMQVDICANGATEVDIWVTDSPEDLDEVRKFLADRDDRQALLLADPGGTSEMPARAVCVDRSLKPSLLRSRLHSLLEPA